MSRLLFIPLLILLGSLSTASELEQRTAFLPLYAPNTYLHEGNEDLHATPRKIIFISRGANPETLLSLLGAPHIPHHDNTWHEAGDTNLISLCGIKLNHIFKKTDDGKFSFEITIDLSSFKKPEKVRLTKPQITTLVRKAIAFNFPHATILPKQKG